MNNFDVHIFDFNDPIEMALINIDEVRFDLLNFQFDEELMTAEINFPTPPRSTSPVQDAAALSNEFRARAERIATAASDFEIGLMLLELGVKDNMESRLKIDRRSSVSSGGATPSLPSDDGPDAVLGAELDLVPFALQPKTLDARAFNFFTYELDSYPPIPGQRSFAIEGPDMATKVNLAQFSILVTSPSGASLDIETIDHFDWVAFAFTFTEFGLHRISVRLTDYGLQHIEGSPFMVNIGAPWNLAEEATLTETVQPESFNWTPFVAGVPAEHSAPAIPDPFGAHAHVAQWLMTNDF